MNFCKDQSVFFDPNSMQEEIWIAELRYNILNVVTELHRTNEVPIGKDVITATDIVKECKIIEKYIVGK